MRPDDCYTRNEHAVTRVIAGETIIVPMKVRIPMKSATEYDPSRPPIPEQAGHPI